jgi:hypothetical protein
MIKHNQGFEAWKRENYLSPEEDFLSALRARAITVSRDLQSRFGKEDPNSPTSLQRILRELRSAKPGAAVLIPKLKPSSLTYLTSKLNSERTAKMAVTPEIARQEMLKQAEEKAQELPINLQETSNFSFQHSFAILAHPNGGFVIQQMFTGKPQYSRAFSNLDDLVNYLTAQKEAFLMMEDQS